MSQPSGVKATRQRFNVYIGWIGVVIGALLAVAGAFSHSGRPMLYFGAAFAALSFCVMARPSLRFTTDAVIVSNVVREVTLPWEGISHTDSRGSLVIHDNDGGRTTVWAIGSQKARSDRDMQTSGAAGSWRPEPGSLVELPTSSRALREALNAETVDNPTGTPSGKSVRFLPLPTALMVLALVCVVVGILA